MSQEQSRSQQVKEGFAQHFGREPLVVVRAPGRVNLIGEHTDYNDGFVLPIAIDRSVLFAAAPRPDRRVVLHALDLRRETSFDLGYVEEDEDERWSNYQRGVAHFLQAEGYWLKGMDALFTSNVPVGAGLSSSAAVEIAAAYTFSVLGNFTVDRVRMALLCQRAENEFAGVPCGIMDQFIVGLGKRDHALLLDCRSLEYEQVPLPAGARIVVADTRVSRSLAASAYAVRRAQCEEAARLLGVRALRDVTPETFEQRAGELDEVVRRRAHHVISENARVQESVAALGRGDLARFGHLMCESHRSLRDDYEVSGPELDIMVGAATQVEGCYGSRLTGAGFGGCTVSLVANDAVDEFTKSVAARYRAQTGKEPAIYVCTAADGVSLQWQGGW
ncbi:MAG: galactokinase [Anaerolineae bacterium]|nr:galactokinase [Anaerolineae bacterium]